MSSLLFVRQSKFDINYQSVNPLSVLLCLSSSSSISSHHHRRHLTTITAIIISITITTITIVFITIIFVIIIIVVVIIIDRHIISFCFLSLILLGVTDPCYSKKCPPYAKCEPRFGTFAKCICPARCSLLFDPACGTDQKSYFNLCALQMKACQSNEMIRVAFKGTCGMVTMSVTNIYSSLYLLC